jgi:hypothetical protein
MDESERLTKTSAKKYAHAKHKNKPNQAHEAIVSKEQVVQQFHNFSGCDFEGVPS